MQKSKRFLNYQLRFADRQKNTKSRKSKKGIRLTGILQEVVTLDHKSMEEDVMQKT